jgi:hypothetical protein
MLALLTTRQWAHIGRIVFAGTNDQLYELTGPGNKENFTSESFFLFSFHQCKRGNSWKTCFGSGPGRLEVHSKPCSIMRHVGRSDGCGLIMTSDAEILSCFVHCIAEI